MWTEINLTRTSKTEIKQGFKRELHTRRFLVADLVPRISNDGRNLVLHHQDEKHSRIEIPWEEVLGVRFNV